MKIQANSKKFEIGDNTSVADFIRQLKLEPSRCVVELNKKAMRYAQFADIKLVDGDVLEIMTVVAGG